MSWRDDEDPWADDEAAELGRLDTDLEMAGMRAAGNAVAAARKAGRCPHQGAAGYLAGEDRGLKPGQLRCNDNGQGCGAVWDSDEDWYTAMDKAISLWRALTGPATWRWERSMTGTRKAPATPRRNSWRRSARTASPTARGRTST